MIKRVQSATTGLQILLFSATFNQAVIDFAKDVVGTEAHQASCKWGREICHQQPNACLLPGPYIPRTKDAAALQNLVHLATY